MNQEVPVSAAASGTVGQGAERARVIVVGNEKGGSGKSTSAVHLIVALLRTGRRVASIDLDIRQELSAIWKIANPMRRNGTWDWLFPIISASARNRNPTPAG